jgi:hypothetical protein
MVLKVGWRVLVLGIVAGVFICLGTGIIEQPRISIMENKYYGVPLVWRISNLNTGETYLGLELVADLAFWACLIAVIMVLASMMLQWAKVRKMIS